MGHSFGSSTRASSGSPRRELSPGPGSYAVHEHALSTTTPALASPRYGFGTSQRQGHRDSATPGPGTYVEKPTLSARSHTFGQRCNTQRDPGTPGPGAHAHPSLF